MRMKKAASAASKVVSQLGVGGAVAGIGSLIFISKAATPNC
jgi:hypothetical protein